MDASQRNMVAKSRVRHHFRRRRSRVYFHVSAWRSFAERWAPWRVLDGSDNGAIEKSVLWRFVSGFLFCRSAPQSDSGKKNNTLLVFSKRAEDVYACPRIRNRPPARPWTRWSTRDLRGAEPSMSDKFDGPLWPAIKSDDLMCGCVSITVSDADPWRTVLAAHAVLVERQEAKPTDLDGKQSRADRKRTVRDFGFLGTHNHYMRGMCRDDAK